jgi:hypothetical protein
MAEVAGRMNTGSDRAIAVPEKGVPPKKMLVPAGIFWVCAKYAQNCRHTV